MIIKDSKKKLINTINYNNQKYVMYKILIKKQ